MDRKERDEAFVNCAFVEMDLKRNKNQKHQLRLKIDTGAQGNTIPLRVVRQIFPNNVDSAGLPVDVDSVRGIKLTVYNGSPIKCHGAVNIPCRYDSKTWLATNVYVVDVQGPAVVGIPSSEKTETSNTSLRYQHTNTNCSYSRRGQADRNTNDKKH
jgi:hypothetical protein